MRKSYGTFLAEAESLTTTILIISKLLQRKLIV